MHLPLNNRGINHSSAVMHSRVFDERDHSSFRIHLDDGSVDSAPNLISPDLQLPDTLRSVIREDWKFLTLVSTGIAAVCGVMLAAAVSMAGMSGDPAMAQLLANSYPAY